MPKRFYLTTTLPYVNAAPHLGFALEIVQADIIARYHALLGEAVFFNTGTDEHGLKIFQQAQKEKKATQEYADEYAAKFRDLKKWLGLSEDLNFIRTTDPSHIAAAQAFWKRCDKNGYIYKKNYQIKYCVGCELEKTDSELENGKCALHPNLELEIIEEENYFFKFSQFQDRLLALYKNQSNFVLPVTRLNEIRAFVERGLQDFSISRLASKLPWGVPVPGDEAGLPAGRQVMYVWFDALVNYISAIGWPADLEKFKLWWPVVQFAGKDNLRQQAAMWQAMLLAADLPPSKQIIIHGFINVGGQKMSKSLGNVIDPIKLVQEYGTDALRYYLARHVHPFEDSDFTLEKFKEAYNANLANGLGNLVSRVMKMATSNGITKEEKNLPPPVFDSNLENYEFNKSMDAIWSLIAQADGQIQITKPFSLIKTDRERASIEIKNLLFELNRIAVKLEPFMPETSKKIQQAIRENKMPEALFPRKD